MTGFDKFTIRQWREGYTLEVGIRRPRNSPKFRHTDADFRRTRIVARKNLELAEVVFKDLTEVMQEIKRLELK